MGERLDEFEIKLLAIKELRNRTDISEESKEEQESYLWKVINKIWKGMGPIETECSKEVMDRIFP